MPLSHLPDPTHSRGHLVARIHETLTLPPAAIAIIEKRLHRLDPYTLAGVVNLIDLAFAMLDNLPKPQPEELPHGH